MDIYIIIIETDGIGDLKVVVQREILWITKKAKSIIDRQKTKFHLKVVIFGASIKEKSKFIQMLNNKLLDGNPVTYYPLSQLLDNKIFSQINKNDKVIVYLTGHSGRSSVNLMNVNDTGTNYQNDELANKNPRIKYLLENNDLFGTNINQFIEQTNNEKVQRYYQERLNTTNWETTKEKLKEIIDFNVNFI